MNVQKINDVRDELDAIIGTRHDNSSVILSAGYLRKLQAALTDQPVNKLAASWKLRAIEMEKCNVSIGAQFLRECAEELEAMIEGREANRTSWFKHEVAAIEQPAPDDELIKRADAWLSNEPSSKKVFAQDLIRDLRNAVACKPTVTVAPDDVVEAMAVAIANEGGGSDWWKHLGPTEQEQHRDEAKAALAAAQAHLCKPREVVPNFEAHLISVIADIQNALGFTEDEVACSNGSAEIVGYIRQLQANQNRHFTDADIRKLAEAYADSKQTYIDVAAMTTALESLNLTQQVKPAYDPAQWKLVPIEPTKAMLSALATNFATNDKGAQSMARFRAMLAAAPSPPEQDKP
jgi:hypothetical protein